MAPIITVTADPQLSLEQLNTVIAQQEEFLGAPLVTIGNNGSQTLLGFDEGADPPGTHAFVSVDNPPANAKPLAWGKILVSGRLTDVVALRQG
jgi:hypothetical protein